MTTRDRRVFIGGVIGVVGLILAFRGIPAWRAWRAEALAAAFEMRSQAAQTETVLAGFSQDLDSLEARTRRLAALGPALFAAETPREAASNLAALVGELGRQSLVRVDAVEIRVDTARGKILPRVSVEARATADIAGLASLLQRFEKGPDLLALRRLVVRPQNVQSPSDQPEQLWLQFTVEALALLPERKAP